MIEKVLKLCSIFLMFSCFSAHATDAALLIHQGEDELKAGQIDEAIATLQQAVVEDPQSSQAHTRLGGALVLNQQYDAGIESFRQAIALDPDGSAAYLGMAIGYIHMGHYGLARSSLEEAERRDPGKRQEIERVVAWLDQRMKGMTSD